MKSINVLIFFLDLFAIFIVKNVEGQYDKCHTAYELTYHVSIQNDRNWHLCSGGIIAEKFVLTAAQCVIQYGTGQFKGEKLTVVAGSIDIRKTFPTEVRIPVEKIYTLQEYRPRKSTPQKPYRVIGDIAVLQLKKGLGLGSSPNITKLELSSGNFLSDYGVVGGYGLNWDKTHDKNPYPYRKLRLAVVELVDSDKCDGLYDRDRKKSTLCAKAIKREFDIQEKICTADPGSPLVIENYVYGIFYEHPEGCKEGIQYYTDVARYRSQFIDYALQERTPNNFRVGVFKDDGSFSVTERHDSRPYNINEDELVPIGK